MTTVLKRGGTFHYSETIAGRRIRCALGTSDAKSAKRLASRVSFAVADGPDSETWSTLRLVLPPASYRTLATGMSVSTPPDLAEFEILFKQQLDRREKLGEIAAGTHKLYETASEIFFTWLAEQGVFKMDGVTPTLVEKYQVWRKNELSSKPQSKNGVGLRTDNTVLAAIFELAMQERLISKSPFKGRFRCYGDPKIATPYSSEELLAMESHVSSDNRLAFLIFRWTGMRATDVAEITWSAIDTQRRVLRWKTGKRGVRIEIPISEQLILALVDWSTAYSFSGKGVASDDRILQSMTRAKLYSIIRKLGEKAGIKGCHPHRFRATIATQMLSDGLTLWDVAKFLGDSMSVIEKHYAVQTQNQIGRAREFLTKTEKSESDLCTSLPT